MSSSEVRLACLASPARARSLLTVRAAISSAFSSPMPRSRKPSLMWSYWRSRLALQARCGMPWNLRRGFDGLQLARLLAKTPAEPVDERDHHHRHDHHRDAQRAEQAADVLVMLAELVPGEGQGQVPGDSARQGGADEGAQADAREAGREGDVGADNRQQPPQEHRPDAVAVEEAVGQQHVAGPDAQPPAGAEQDALPVALGHPE